MIIRTCACRARGGGASGPEDWRYGCRLSPTPLTDKSANSSLSSTTSLGGLAATKSAQKGDMERRIRHHFGTKPYHCSEHLFDAPRRGSGRAPIRRGASPFDHLQVPCQYGPRHDPRQSPHPKSDNPPTNLLALSPRVPCPTPSQCYHATTSARPGPSGCAGDERGPRARQATRPWAPATPCNRKRAASPTSLSS